MRFHMSSFMQNFPHERLILVRAPSIFMTEKKAASLYLAHLEGMSGAYAPCKCCRSAALLFLFLHQPPGTLYKLEAELKVWNILPESAQELVNFQMAVSLKGAGKNRPINQPTKPSDSMVPHG